MSQAPGPQATSSGASQGDEKEEDRVQPAGHATEHSEDEVDGASKKHFDGGANGESVQHHISSSVAAAKENEAPGEDDEQQPPPENHHRDADETAQQYASVNLRVGQ